MPNTQRLQRINVSELPFSEREGGLMGMPSLREPQGSVPVMLPPVSSSTTPSSVNGHGDDTLKAKIAQFGVVAETDLRLKKLQDELAASQASLEQWSHTEQVWNSQRRLFKVMTENVSDLIVLLDPKGNRMWNNPAYSHTLGYLPEDLAGTYGLAEVHPDDRGHALEAFDHAVEQKTTQQAEYRMQRKDGQFIDLQTEIVPIVNEEGRLESLVLLAHDVTQLKRLEGVLEHASRQMTHSHLVENLARDFDQLLTKIFGNLAIARNLNGSNNAVGMRLVEIERSLQRTREMVEQMTSLSNSGGPTREFMALPSLVQEIVGGMLHGTVVRAEFNFSRSLPDIELDVEAFTSALRALLANSLQAMDKGMIRVSAELVSREQLAQHPDIPLKPGSYACLVIRDQGHGMTERTLMHAFEPYFTTRTSAQGLGLTTALAAFQRMGGTLLLDSTEFVGTTAYVYLPASISAAKARTGTVALPAAAPIKRRILLMDDEQMILDIVSRMLTHLHYDVTVCTDGAQAIAAFAKAKMQGTPFDVVLMDLVIPNGVGGQDAVHTIRKIDGAAKVIASSGHLEHPAMTDHKKFGFAAILEKPYKLEHLQQVIDQVITATA